MNTYKPPSNMAQIEIVPESEAAQAAGEVTGYSPPKKRMPIDPVRLIGGLAASVATGMALGKLIDGRLRPQTHTFDGWLLDATRSVPSKPVDSAMGALSNMGEARKRKAGKLPNNLSSQPKTPECELRRVKRERKTELAGSEISSY